MFVHVLCKAIWQLCTLDLDSVYYLKKEREKKNSNSFSFCRNIILTTVSSSLMKRSFEYYHIMVTKKATTEILSNFVSSFKLFFCATARKKRPMFEVGWYSECCCCSLSLELFLTHYTIWQLCEEGYE